MSEPDKVIEQIKEALMSAQETWETKLDNPPLLKGFYLCADYATTEGQHIFFAISANGAGEQLPDWTVEGYLTYALHRGHYGASSCSCDDHEEG